LWFVLRDDYRLDQVDDPPRRIRNGASTLRFSAFYRLLGDCDVDFPHRAEFRRGPWYRVHPPNELSIVQDDDNDALRTNNRDVAILFASSLAGQFTPGQKNKG
jgi:hypothetical protein